MEYIVNKREFKKKDISFIEIFFDNGDYLSISKTEIIDIYTRLYDKLILGTDYWNPFCAVVESGYLKLKLLKKANGIYSNAHVFNVREYNKDRINYIKNRLCNDCLVTSIKLFDENNWHFTLYCQIETKLEDDILILQFIPRYNEQECKSDTHSIMLPEIDKSVIAKFELDFENCEGVNIYAEEIVEMQINCDKELCWGSGDYVRQVESGFLKIKLDNEKNKWRKNSLFDELANGNKGNNQIQKRLCGKKGFDLHDLCHLYIEYDYAGFGTYKRECLEINDLRSDEEFEAIENWEDKNEDMFLPCYIGGFAEKIDDDTILITFGNTALKNERCQKELKKCSFFNIKE